VRSGVRDHRFATAGTDGLESPEVLRLLAVVQAGGLAALKVLGKPADILRETKTRLFAV
jgi:type I restriction enzyme R subunit